MLHALTGKDPADVMKPEIKGSSYLSIMPMHESGSRCAPAAGRHAEHRPRVGQNALGRRSERGAAGGRSDAGERSSAAGHGRARPGSLLERLLDGHG